METTTNTNRKSHQLLSLMADRVIINKAIKAARRNHNFGEVDRLMSEIAHVDRCREAVLGMA